MVLLVCGVVLHGARTDKKKSPRKGDKSTKASGKEELDIAAIRAIETSTRIRRQREAPPRPIQNIPTVAPTDNPTKETDNNKRNKIRPRRKKKQVTEEAVDEEDDIDILGHPGDEGEVTPVTFALRLAELGKLNLQQLRDVAENVVPSDVNYDSSTRNALIAAIMQHEFAVDGPRAPPMNPPTLAIDPVEFARNNPGLMQQLIAAVKIQRGKNVAGGSGSGSKPKSGSRGKKRPLSEVDSFIGSDDSEEGAESDDLTRAPKRRRLNKKVEYPLYLASIFLRNEKYPFLKGS